LATGQKDDEKLIVRSICELTEKIEEILILYLHIQFLEREWQFWKFTEYCQFMERKPILL